MYIKSINNNYLILLFLLYFFIYNTHQWCLKSQFADGLQINDIDFSRDGTKFITSSNSKRVIVWNSSTLQPIKIYSAKFSKDGTMIGVGGNSDIAYLINAATYTNTSLTTTLTKVWGVDFNENNNMFIACGQSGTTNLYDLTIIPYTYKNCTNRGKPNLSCRFAKNITKIAMGTNNADLYVLDYNNSAMFVGTPTATVKVGKILAAQWNDITSQAYFGGSDKNLYFISNTGGNVKSISIGKDIYTISVTEDGAYAAVGGEGGSLFLYNVNKKGSQVLQQTLTQSTNNLTASAFSYNGEYLITGNQKGTMFLYKRLCAGCPSGTYANATECRLCNKDIPGCYLCMNSSYCMACSNGKYLNTTDNKCYPCYNKLTGCNQCSNSTDCISCSTGFYLVTSVTPNVCNYCWSVLKGCLSCNSTSYCYACDLRYYLDSSTYKCVSCSNISKCLTCNSSSYCLECVQGYYQNGTGGCTQCTQNCSYCINGTYCTQCDSSFYLNGGVCNKCTVDGCLACNSSNYCFDCIQSTYENNGTCSICFPPCLECSTSATSCDACIVGYYLNGTSCISCKNITQGCISCIGSGSTDCTSCATGYYKTTGNLCSLCKNLLPNCFQCTSSACLKCRVGFYLFEATVTLVNTACKNCSQGCLTCLDSTVCLSCQVGFYHTSPANICTRCPIQCASCQSSTVCYSCNPKYYYNSTDKKCTKCSISNCLTCRDSTYCLTCIQGYFPNNSNTVVCQSCSNNINNCISCYNQSYCKGCRVGYYLTNSSNSSCSKCASSCQTCDFVDCFTCQLGYYLDTTASPKKCKSCPKQCSQCVTSTNCTSCVSGYYLPTSSNTCTPCENIETGCQQCNSSQCFSCKNQLGYFFNSTDKKCISCSSKIQNCFSCSINNSTCLSCDYGYVLTTTNSKCESCSKYISNCQNCYNTSNCQTCIKNYYYDLTNNSCISCSQGCQTCKNLYNCQICLRQFVLQSDFSCKLCQRHIMGCEQCNYINTTTVYCYNCINGFYYYNNSCVICSQTLQGCSICQNDTVCLECKPGYYLNTTDQTCKICDSGQSNCQLCQYDMVNLLINCQACDQGYFLTASNSCQQCTDLACFSCSNSTNCLRCHSGYYLSSGSCVKCLTTYSGCNLCNSTSCLQCGSGFYLNNSNNNICLSCNIIGCQICSQSNPKSQCLKCDTQYFLTSNSSCELCKVSLKNCIQCTTTSNCQLCDSGYFIQSNGTCSLCDTKFVGCSLCSPSICLQCDSGYLLNGSNLCQVCTQFISGCSFCLSPSTCISCQSGFFAQNNTCYRCSSLSGCLQCKNSSICLFCDYGYFLDNDTCKLCNTSIDNCVDCLSSIVCTTCLGNFVISGGICAQLKGQSYPHYQEVKFITQYISGTQLKNTILSVGKKIYQMMLDWKKQSTIYLIDDQYQQVKLTVKRSQFQEYSLILFTDNPLGDLSNLNGMPLIKTSLKRMLIQQNNRILQDSFSFDNRLKTKLQMSQVAFNSLFPDIHHTGAYFTKYDLSEPQFYKSVLKSRQYYYNIFGIIISCLLVIIYFVKNFMFVPNSPDKGQMIPHILCYKMMGLIMYPVYAQYLNYCQGFTVLDLPWFNSYFAKQLTVKSDIIPQALMLTYDNLNFPSTYLFAFIIFISLYSISYLVLNIGSKKKQIYKAFTQYLMNIFSCGLIISSSFSLQGAYYNHSKFISVNAFSYIFGIAVYVGLILQMIFNIYRSMQNNNIPFHKPRILIKCTCLSFAYLNPLYIFMSLIFLDVCLLVIQYILKKQKKLMPRLWLTNNIILNVGLSFMMIGSFFLLSIVISSICIVISIGIQIYIIIKQKEDYQTTLKMKLHQTELVKTLQQFEKSQQSSRSKNHQIYFRNKILQEWSSQDIIANYKINDKSNQSYQDKNLDSIHQSKPNLYFQEKNQHSKLIFQDNDNQSNEIDQIKQKSKKYHNKVDELKPKKKRPKMLREKKKQQNIKIDKQQQQNPGVFVLSQFN